MNVKLRMMDKNQEQAKEDLREIKEHHVMVENVIYALTHINADLMDHNLNYARHEGRSFIEGRFNYLETHEPANQYLQTFGAFYRLYNYLKVRFETEVINHSKQETKNC